MASIRAVAYILPAPLSTRASAPVHSRYSTLSFSLPSSPASLSLGLQIMGEKRGRKEEKEEEKEKEEEEEEEKAEEKEGG